MKKSIILFLAFSVIACGSSSRNVTGYTMAMQEARNAADAILQAGGTSVGLAMVSRDGLVFARGYGQADVAASVPATEKTMFPIGSVSKIFAAVAVMQLVDQGLVDLDQTVVKYLPSFKMADPRYTQITVRMLLNHTSGMPGTIYTAAETTVPAPGYADAVLASLTYQRLKADPGAFAFYCNDGWTLTDPLVAAVGKMSYVDWVKKKIFEPLGMNHSTFSLAPLPEGSFAKAYRSGTALPQEYVNVDAAGGIYSTTADMAAFVRMFLNGGMSDQGIPVLSPESVRRMGMDQTVGTFNPVPNAALAYGLGWDTVSETGLGSVGVKAWTKNGGTFFYGSQNIVAPDVGLGAVALGPTGGGYAPLAILQRVLLRALVEDGRLAAYPASLPAQTAPVAAAPAGLLASVDGIYANYAHVYKLKAEADGTVTLRVLTASGFPVAPASVLKYRTDGWFTSDAAPLNSFQVVSAGTDKYLALRAPGANQFYLDTQAFAIKVTSPGPALSPAWSGRIGKQWLVVNEHPAGIPFLVDEDPRFGLMTLADVPGSLFALTAIPPINMGWQAQAVDASASDQKAGMMLLIPGIQGTDIYDLDVLIRGGEEWLRWGGYLHRPLDKAPVLPASTVSSVAFGPEGYAEWVSIPLKGVSQTLSISGVSAWRLYDNGFKTLAAGGASGNPVLAPGAGLAYLMLFGGAGGAGGSASVTVP
ncbi:MAG: serine hydrolase domain-containing protein [Pseudomonadota bacterium]|nr:serine hydrolase domain-containing protein [Pseudomonadota bacterium]